VRGHVPLIPAADYTSMPTKSGLFKATAASDPDMSQKDLACFFYYNIVDSNTE